MRWPSFEQKKLIFDEIDYQPHVGQLLLHKATGRVMVVAGGERAGKSRSVAGELTARALWCKRVALISGEYEQTRPEARYVIEDMYKLGLLDGKPSTPRNGKWEWKLKSGTVFETLSANRGSGELSGKGVAYDVVAVCEAGLTPFNVFNQAIGRVAETRGLVLLSGTLLDTIGWYSELYQAMEGPNMYGGTRVVIPSWMNTVVYPGGRNDPEILRLEGVLPPDEFTRRVCAEMLPSPARIYPEFSFTKHVVEIELGEEPEVDLTVDAGYADTYVVLVLRTEGGRVDVCDEVCMTGHTDLDVINLCREKFWWKNVKTVVVGHEGKQHSHTSGKSTRDIWSESIGTVEGDPEANVVVFDAGRVLDGIMRVRTFLKDPSSGEPRIFFGTNCPYTHSEFTKYSRRTDVRGNVISEQPVDRDNHAMDCIRNYLVYRFGFVDRRARPAKKGKPLFKTLFG